MEKFALNVVVLLALVAATAAVNKEDYHDFQTIMKVLSKPRVLDREKYTNMILRYPGNVRGVTWRNCGSSSDPMQVKSLSISPDPVKLPGNVTVGFSIDTSVQLSAPVKVELTIKKKIIFWIEVPCVDNIGSCTYDDVCQLLTTIQCPAAFLKAKIPCQCPYKPGTYTLPNSQVTIPPVNLPSWLENGDYQLSAKLSSKGQPLGCVFVQLSLTK